MTKSDNARKTPWRDRLRKLTTPRGSLGVLLVAATALYFLPSRLTEPARNAWSILLRPAQAITGTAVDFARDKLARLRAGLADADRLAEAERQVAELQQQNRRLESALDAARIKQSDSAADGSSGSATEPLLHSEALSARVLGNAAQTFLRGHELLDVGSRAGASPGALVIDDGTASTAAKPLIDAGRDLGVEPGRVVLAGRRVWGKLASVGQYTSVVQRVSDRGYRDTVQLAHRDGDQLRLGPRGVLVGGGDPLCQIELVDATEPVSVGDEVCTAGDGALPTLIYGRIVRVERPVGGAHWQIWMQPAVGADEPREVAVLRVELNPSRMADSAGKTLK